MQFPVGSRAIRTASERQYRLESSIAKHFMTERTIYLNEQLQYFVGLDWGTENHRVVLLNFEGRVIEQYDAGHSGKDLAILIDRLRSTCQCPPRAVGIAIEVAWGAVVDTLMENDFSVFSINRSKWTASATVIPLPAQKTTLATRLCWLAH